MAEPLDEAAGATERAHEDVDRDSSPEQAIVVRLVGVDHPPAAAQFSGLTEPTRTAVGPTTERHYPSQGHRYRGVAVPPSYLGGGARPPLRSPGEDGIPVVVSQ